jgi:hypothetical protein
MNAGSTPEYTMLPKSFRGTGDSSSLATRVTMTRALRRKLRGSIIQSIPEEKSVFWKVTVSVVLSRKVYVYVPVTYYERLSR